MKTIDKKIDLVKKYLNKCLEVDNPSAIDAHRKTLNELKDNIHLIEIDNGEQLKDLYRSLKEKTECLVNELDILTRNQSVDEIFNKREGLLQQAINTDRIPINYKQLIKSIEKLIRKFQIGLEDDPEQVRQSCWWFIEQGDEDDLVDISKIEIEISIDPDRLPVYANNPDLVEMLIQAKESIVIRIVKQKNPNLYKLAAELFTNDSAIARWFISSKKFLNGRTPLSCLKDPEGVKLVERQIGQSLAGVSA